MHLVPGKTISIKVIYPSKRHLPVCHTDKQGKKAKGGNKVGTLVAENV